VFGATAKKNSKPGYKLFAKSGANHKQAVAMVKNFCRNPEQGAEQALVPYNKIGPPLSGGPSQWEETEEAARRLEPTPLRAGGYWPMVEAIVEMFSSVWAPKH
jgi:hypothetical protein